MLNLDDDHPREVGTGPFLVELVGLLLNNPVVAFKFEPIAVFRFQVWIGRRLAKAAKVGRKVTVEDGQRIASVRMRIKTFGQKDVCAQIHGPAPKIRK